MLDLHVLELGDFALQRGSVLPDARLAYGTLGTLNEARDNVILCPTWLTGTPPDVAAVMTGPGRALDPERWFIVIPNHFGAEISSSPSNTPPPFEGPRFPITTTYDNVAAQHRLLTEALGVERIALATSWSMGACQCYAWAAAHPEMVGALAPISGSARTAEYNKVFLHANMQAIRLDPVWNNGYYDHAPHRGMRAMAAIYAGWALSEEFYRNEEYRAFGASNVPEFVEWFWEAFYVKRDANDLLAQFRTWWHNDVADHPAFGGDYAAALGAISCPTTILQGELDRYFPPVDSAREAELIPQGKLVEIESTWGHMCPMHPPAQEIIDRELRVLLEVSRP